MEVKAKKLEEVIVDILCDVCHQATALEFGTLKAHWGYGSKHDGERYEVQLCETCCKRPLNPTFSNSLIPR